MTANNTQRRKALAARRALDAGERLVMSSRIARRFLRTAYFFRSAAIGCYLPMDDEVDATDVFDRAWRAGKRVFVPVMRAHRRLDFIEIRRDTRLVRNSFGIWEPGDGRAIRARDLDVCIVPTVAFDASGNRIGMGGGYYDRAFEFLNRPQRWRRPRLVGFAFECQRVESIQTNHWDVALDVVITERTQSATTRNDV